MSFSVALGFNTSVEGEQLVKRKWDLENKLDLVRKE